MTEKITGLCVFALLFACSAVYGAESAGQMKTGKAQSASTGTVKGAEAGKKAKAVARKVTKEEVGKDAVCPVTGEKFKVTAGTGSASYKGKIYYFCCPACDKPFLENPEKYVGKKQAAQAKKYVCPMGDYQGGKPGKCPKCGMDLKEKK